MGTMPVAAATLLIALAGGMAVGVFFFGGLWLSVQMLPRTSRPALWFVVSFGMRSAAALGGFYWIAGQRWLPWLVCLLGFLLSRSILVRQARAGMMRGVKNAPPGSTAG